MIEIFLLNLVFYGRVLLFDFFQYFTTETSVILTLALIPILDFIYLSRVITT